jgi:cytochrome oxidase Cu insertion factor (SCO1/SenC/PrrC family)
MIFRIALAFVLAACVLASAPGRTADKSPNAPHRRVPVGVGELAPDFTLPDQDGRPHTLSAERGQRAVVLIFYRGHW